MSPAVPRFVLVNFSVLIKNEDSETVIGFGVYTFGGMFLSKNFLGGAESAMEGRRNSCIIQSVFMPLAARPL